MEGYEVEVPSYFLCPISMQLMKDPVTVSTGISYDRENIERWLFSFKNTTCPVTNQQVLDTDLTPNHTLRRLIQAWCTLNSSYGIERIPTPKAAVDKSYIIKLLDEGKKSPQAQINCLQRLRSIAQSNNSSRRQLEAAGAVEYLASIIKKDALDCDQDSDISKASDEALNILYHLEISDSVLRKILGDDDDQFLEGLLHVLKCGNYQSRAQAITMLKSALNVVDPVQVIGVKPEFFIEIVQIFHDKISQQVSKAALKLLVELCPWGRNRVKAVESGLVSTLIELLLATSERRACELILTVLDQLCGCAEGRAELLKHGAGLAIVSKKILRASHVATDKAVRIISSISKFSANSRVLQEMLQVGVVTKLCLVLQVGSSQKTKERTKEILMQHSRVWKKSSCVPPHLISSYPFS
ncbi:E3 ubiquitin- ligase PUB23-like [Olea europaea subsp. europaea]|uniref:U-box domain-containing protein n=1 Tax=Olea europaea subsp. europaea TaxID=158383 RepID=A0A8S0SKM1_OLEEU|nr:E3 ubiquitin- ligase PUB23-like [Olea europaea subsp. europaea]